MSSNFIAKNLLIVFLDNKLSNFFNFKIFCYKILYYLVISKILII